MEKNMVVCVVTKIVSRNLRTFVKPFMESMSSRQLRRLFREMRGPPLPPMSDSDDDSDVEDVTHYSYEVLQLGPLAGSDTEAKDEAASKTESESESTCTTDPLSDIDDLFESKVRDKFGAGASVTPLQPQPQEKAKLKQNRRNRRRANRRRRQRRENADQGESSSDAAEEGEADAESDEDGQDQEEARSYEKKQREQKKLIVKLSDGASGSQEEVQVEKHNIKIDHIGLISMNLVAMLASPKDGVPPEEIKGPVVKEALYTVEENTLEDLFDINLDTLLITNTIRKCLSGIEVENATPGRNRKYRKAMVIEYPQRNIGVSGIGMSVVSQDHETGARCFAYNHSAEYQNMHCNMLDAMTEEHERFSPAIERSMRMNHIESQIMIFENMWRQESYTEAIELLQKMVAVLQFSTCHEFDLTDHATTLPYKYLENRPFFVVMVKMIYVLSKKGYHTKALEIAKMLMNLDDTDPMGLLFIIDILALKAEKYEWLMSVLNHWCVTKHASLMFNVLFSHTLAYFHCVCKSGSTEDKRFANELMLNAILNYPYVVTAILQEISSPDTTFAQESHLFGTFARKNTTEPLRKLMHFYAKQTASLWSQKNTRNWLLYMCGHVALNFCKYEKISDAMSDICGEYCRVFQNVPEEIRRHLIVAELFIEPVDLAEPASVRRNLAFDPLAPDSEVDQHNYFAQITEEPRVEYNCGLGDLVYHVDDDVD